MKRRFPQIPGQISIFKAFKTQCPTDQPNESVSPVSSSEMSSQKVSNTLNSEADNIECITLSLRDVTNDNSDPTEVSCLTNEGDCSSVSGNLSEAASGTIAKSDIDSSHSVGIQPSFPTLSHPRTTSNSPRFLDIGTLDTMRRLSLSDKQRLEALNSRFQPTKGWEAPLRACGKKYRRVPDFVFNETLSPFLRYSPVLDGVFCAPCFIFSNASNSYTLVTRPLTDWSNAKRIVDIHVKSEDHQNAIFKAKHFIKICNKEEQNILEFGSNAYKNKVKKNREILVSIIGAVIVCGRQNLALRGKTEDRSNFRALLNYRAEKDDLLREHIASAPKHATYMSPEIQNEFIFLCGQQIAHSITERCKSAQYFTVMADESADVSNVEQFAFCIRFTEKTNTDEHTVNEEFLSFVSTRSITGEVLHDLLMEEIRKHDLNPNYIVGQGYDGAGNMSGKIRGVQARVTQQYPNAKYVHCRNHRLNLAICHACRIAFVQSMFTVVGDTLFFLTNSPKRVAIYQQHNDNAEMLKKLCPTRWSQHSESVSAFYRNFEAIEETLVDLQTNTDTKTMSTASSFHKAILTFDFIIALCVAGKPLDILTPLSNAMQDPTCDLVKASDHAMALQDVLLQKRGEVQYYDEIYEAATNLADQQNVVVGRPRIAGRQQHRNNVPADTVKEYWRLNLFLPFMDHLRSELEDRLCVAHPRLKAQYLLSNKIDQLTTAMWGEIKNEYDPFIDANAIDAELEVWKHQIANRHLVADRLCKAMDVSYQLHPNLYSIFKVLLTMPVSTASAERSFSSLRRLKTYLRNTMTEQRLTGLALMHIHRNIDVNVNRVINDFDATGHRRIALVFNNMGAAQSSDDE